MEQQSEQNNQPSPVDVGHVLRAARESAGLSLAEVADRLKLSLRQLEAIERDDFAALPGPAFVRGFVKNYARFLEIDVAPLMQALDARFPSAATEVANLARNEKSPSGSSGNTESNSGAWVVVGLIAIVLLAIAVWIFGRNNESQLDLAPVVSPQTASDLAAASVSPTSQASAPAQLEAVAALPKPTSSPLPVVAAKLTASATVLRAPNSSAASARAEQQRLARARTLAAAKATASKAAEAARAARAARESSHPSADRNASAPSPVLQPVPAVKSAPASGGDSSAAGKISVSVTEPAWVAVTDAAGKKLLYAMVSPGAPRQVHGVRPFKLRIGNADKVSVTYNGQAVNLTDHIRGATASVMLN